MLDTGNYYLQPLLLHVTQMCVCVFYLWDVRVGTYMYVCVWVYVCVCEYTYTYTVGEIHMYMYEEHSQDMCGAMYSYVYE